jgi:hypothetical protein
MTFKGRSPTGTDWALVSRAVPDAISPTARTHARIENCRWPPCMDGRLIVSTFDKTHALEDRYRSTIDELRNKWLCLSALAGWADSRRLLGRSRVQPQLAHKCVVTTLRTGSTRDSR